MTTVARQETMLSKEFELCFSADEAKEGKFRLLELPHELAKIVESGLETHFSIRGRQNDDAVLCTSSKTYTLRAVTLSNTILVITAQESDEDNYDASRLIVQEQISQILELIPVVPKLQRLEAMLKGCEYDEGHERDEESDEDEDEGRSRKRARYTKNDVLREIQASEGELKQGFKELHILNINGHLRPLSTPYLTQILETLLTALVSQGLPLPPKPIPINTLLTYLDLEHEIPKRVTTQVLPWFGKVQNEQWEMDVKGVVKQVGVGWLMLHKDDPVKISEFMDGWRTAVGDAFSSSTDLQDLQGYYLLTPAPPASSTHITYFPSSALPTTATNLFADLFLTRPKWRAEDIVPFLGSVALDKKEREKLLMKYARAITDQEGVVWYSARATHM